MKLEDAVVSAFNPVNWNEDQPAAPQAAPQQNSVEAIQKRMQEAVTEFKKFSDAQEATINGIVAAVEAKDKNAEQKIQAVAENARKLKTNFERGVFEIMKSLAVDINLL